MHVQRLNLHDELWATPNIRISYCVHNVPVIYNVYDGNSVSVTVHEARMNDLIEMSYDGDDTVIESALWQQNSIVNYKGKTVHRGPFPYHSADFEEILKQVTNALY